jgi:glycolate oxidase iron-sulfur subunit
LLARLLRLYDATGLKGLLQKTGLLRFFSRRLANLQPLAPAISPVFSSRELPTVLPSEAPRRWRVGFLTGCIMDVAYADVNRDTIDLLRAHGCDVVAPRGQGCCGSLHAHYGEMSAARDLARKNIEIFCSEDLDAIVMNSAGCGAFMKEYGHVFHEDPLLAEKAKSVSSKVVDITEFLLDKGLKIHPSLTDGGAPFAGKRVTYHDACHLVHTQKISREPRALIRLIPGITYVELDEATWCCGSAGIYNITQYAASMQLLDRKIAHIRDARPDILVTANPGCLVQIQHGLDRSGFRVELMHTASFLRRACVP